MDARTNQLVDAVYCDDNDKPNVTEPCAESPCLRWVLHADIDKMVHAYPGIILGMGSANERRRYIVTSSLIGWAHTYNDPCFPMEKIGMVIFL